MSARAIASKIFIPQTLPTGQKINQLERVLVPKGKATLISKGMKRIGNIYQEICSVENLRIAEKKARKGKQKQYGVKMFDKDREENILSLQELLKNKHFRNSAYTTFKVYEPKEREVFRLPYYPDRIVHHAVMNKLEALFVSTFTADTYSCIKGRGIHAMAENIKKALRNEEETKYCLKLDIRKFYPSVDHGVLKNLLRRKIKDRDLLWLLDEIIDSAPGLPIGNYLSQYFANFYLTFFDHWMKEVKCRKHYFRYADDLVIFAKTKEELHQLLADIRIYLRNNLKLELKGNYQVFPVAKRGVDVIGYKFFHTHILLRKTIKQRFARMMAKRRNKFSEASYLGWAKHCNSKNLIKKIVYESNQDFQRFRHRVKHTKLRR
jgi:RNA-directed DNA polymerase